MRWVCVHVCACVCMCVHACVCMCVCVCVWCCDDNCIGSANLTVIDGVSGEVSNNLTFSYLAPSVSLSLFSLSLTLSFSHSLLFSLS